MGKLLENRMILLGLSFVLSVGFWFFVAAQNPETEETYNDIDVKINMLNSQIEDAVTPIDVGGEQVTITLRGNANVLAGITEDDIYASIDVDATLPPGTHTLPVSITLPVDNVIITGRYPTGFDIKLDRIVTKTVPVVVDLTSSLSTDIYKFGVYTTMPSAIEISGPELELANIVEAKIQLNITENNMYENSMNIAYVLYGEDGVQINSSSIESEVKSVEVFPNVLVKKGMKTEVQFIGLPLSWGEDEFEYEITPSEIEMYLPINVVDDIDSVVVGAVDLNGKTQDFSEELNPYFEYETIEVVESVKVDVDFKTLTKRIISVSDIEIYNVPVGSNANIVDALPIDITIWGAESDVTAYDSRDLSVGVSLIGLSEGVQTAELIVSTKSNDIAVFGTYDIEVEIE